MFQFSSFKKIKTIVSNKDVENEMTTVNNAATAKIVQLIQN